MAEAWVSVYMRGRMRTMRHLPPGMVVPLPTSPTIALLFRDLQGVDELTDPLRWLQEERAPEVAHVALRRQLEVVQGELRLLRDPYTPQGSRVPTEGHKRALRGLAHPRENSRLLLLLHEALRAEPTAEVLRATFAEIRTAFNSEAEPAPADRASSWVQLPLLSALLQLPAAADPLERLATEYVGDAAFETLCEIIDQTRPPQPVLDGPGVRVRTPHGRIHADGLKVRVDELRFSEAGFSYAARAYISCRMVLARRGVGSAARPSWGGFTDVQDNLGNHYLLELPAWWELDRPWFGHWKERLTVVGYPAVARGATKLTFLNRPGLVSFDRGAFGPASGRIAPIHVGELAWEASVPK